MGLGLLATNAAAAADQASARVYQGKTAQGYRIKLNGKDDQVKLLKFEADLHCTNRTRLTLIESGFLWTSVGGSGSFRDAQFGNTDGVFFRGRMTEKRIRGRVRLEDKTRGVRCRSKWIRFNAGPR
jgi:hypothetical protein